MKPDTPGGLSEEKLSELKKSNNFIDQFSVSILEDIPDANPEWTEACGIAVLSTGIGRGKTTFTRIGPLHLNVWQMFIGSSGISKTTPLEYFVEPTIEALNDLLNEEAGFKEGDDKETKEYLKNPDGSYVMSNGKPVTSTKKAKKQKVDLMLPRTFSLESILAHMKKTGNTQGLISVDEVTGAFKQAATKSYMADLYENYSQMYDCATIRATFVKWGRYKPIGNTYVTALLCGVPTVYSYLPAEYSLQGTANRILPIVGEGEQPRDETSVDDYFSENPSISSSEREKTLEQFAGRLLQIRNSPVDVIGNNTGDDVSQSGAILLKNQNAINAEFKKTDSLILRGFLRRMNEVTLKLVALRHLGGLPVGSTIATPTRQEALWGIKKVWKHYEHYKRFVNNWGGGIEVSRASREQRTDNDFVFDVIKGTGRDGITQEALGKKLTARGINSVPRDRILQSLQEAKMIRCETMESSGGRKPLKWFAVAEGTYLP